MNLVLPPKYYITQVWVLTDALNSDPPQRALYTTYSALNGLAWRYKYEHTPPLNRDEVMAYLRLEKSSFYSQVEQMTARCWIRTTSPRPDQIVFWFLAAPKHPIGEAHSEKSESQPFQSDFSENRREEEEEVINKNQLINHPPHPQKAQLLRAAGVLPKYIETIEVNDAITLEDVLAEIAYCYDPKNKIRIPGTLIGMNIVGNHVPAATYYGSIQHIPPAILERAGLAHLLEAQAAAPGYLSAEPAGNIDATGDAGEDDGPLSLLDRSESELTDPEKWLRYTLNQLSGEMQRNVFETWVRDIQVHSYQAATGHFTVAAPTPLTRDWLDSRLKSTLARYLTGLAKQSVNVNFVVDEELTHA